MNSIARACLIAALVHCGVAVAIAEADDCRSLAGLDLPHTRITIAESVEAGTFTQSSATDAYANLPSFCRVAGSIRPTPDSDIRFEVWMPESNWNGKFVGVGNGAWGGSIPHIAMIEPLLKGYATAATDTGHQGDASDAGFIKGHDDKFIDFGHRAVHETTVAAKATIRSFYGRPSRRALFVSCSTGGRQALMEGYRYPQDYDGISAMAAANPTAGLMVSSLWTSSATLKDAASNVSAAMFELIHRAAVSACDARDGVADGIISSPTRCQFDPAVLQCAAGTDTGACLTTSQVAAMRAIYGGPRNPRTGESIFPGFVPGSEKWLPVQAHDRQPLPAVSSYFRQVVFADPMWDFRTFNYDKDLSSAQRAHAAVVDIPATGLTAYFGQDRKLLLSHGWADPLVPPMATVQFYEAMTTALAADRTSNARLFMIPGMAHCQGGDGPFVFDAIDVLDQWVETGRAPERIVVRNPPGLPRRTRPLCPFPQEAIYARTGSTDDERNFRCDVVR